MKRALFLLSIIAVALLARAEEMPAGYYDAVQGTKDSVLKTTLHNIIQGDTVIRYAYGPNQYHSTSKAGEWQKGDLKAYGTWWGFATTDVQSDGSIWDMYSNNKRYLPIKGGSAAGMDIEHCFPKSWWGGDDNDAYKDLYHLNPSDHSANGQKNNYPPGYCTRGDKFDNGSFRVDSKSACQYGNFFCWEPCDEYKGDFARAYFYIATAYEDYTWVETATTTYNAMTNTDYHEFTPWLQEVLLQWHRNDPVSEKEIERLNAVSSIQHNRNPYIEYPELVEYIWGNKQGEAVNLSDLIRTTSEDYDVPVDAVNPQTFAATDITTTGFTANWKNQGERDYTLDVFQLIKSGHNDTILNMPGLCKDSIDAHSNVTWQLQGGGSATYSGVTEGTYALMLSTTQKIYQIDITGLNIPASTRIVVKAALSKYQDDEGVLTIQADGELIESIPVSLDEKWYSIDLPQGTQEVIVSQQKLGKRISVGQIFIVSGDEKTSHVSLEGYPKNVGNGDSYAVNTPLAEGDSLYYTITPAGLRASNTTLVVGNGESPAEQLTFEVEETETGLIITPSNEDETYLWQIVGEDAIAGMEYLTGNTDMTVEEYWQAYIDMGWFNPELDLNHGTLELIYAEMEAMEAGDYTFIVAGCNTDGVRTSDFYQQPITITEGQLHKDVVFEITVTDIKQTEATISVVPSRDVPYYYDYVEAAALDEYETEEAFAIAYVAFLKQQYGQNLSEKLVTGPDSYTFTAEDMLAAGGDYYAFALAIDMQDTTYMPTVKLVPFSTPTNPYIENFTFEFNYNEETNKVTVIPSIETEPYIWCLFADWEISQKYSGSTEMAWQQNAPIAANLGYSSKGESVVNLNYEIWDDGIYYLCVAGYDHGQTSEITDYEMEIINGHMVTAIEQTYQQRSAVKYIQDGNLLIQRGENLYNAQGQIVRE